MAHLDFEERIAQELKDREIKPSAEGWARLQGRLDYEKKEGIFKLWWMLAAAAVIGAVVLFAPFDNRAIVDSPAIVNQPEVEPGKLVEERSAPTMAIEEVEVAKEQIVNEPTPIKDAAGTQEQLHKIMATQEEAVAEIENEELPMDIPKEEVLSRSDAREAIAAVAGESGAALEVTDAEIDALLAEAMAEVQMEKSAVKTAPIAAANLLEEVEMELEHSFRQQVLEILKEGYRKTKTAVANTID